MLVCCAALLIFYGVYAYARKSCWRCQRAVEGSEQRQCCHTGRDASRAQRVGLVVWLVIAVVVFAALVLGTARVVGIVYFLSVTVIARIA